MYSWLKSLVAILYNFQSKNKKISTYFFFFLISFSFWFLNMLSSIHEVTLNIPIVYRNPPPDLILSNDVVDEIQVRVKAPGFSIIGYNIFNFKQIDLDVSYANFQPIKNGQEIFWLINSKRNSISKILGNSMEILDIKPKKLKINSKNKLKKKVPILLSSSIELEEGFWIREKIKINPDSIFIYGTQEYLDNISSISTEQLDIDNLHESLDLSLRVNNVDDVQFKESEVDVTIVVEPYVEKIFSKKVLVKNLKSGYSARIFPEDIMMTIRLPKEKYSIFKSDIFNIEVDGNHMFKNNSTLEILVSDLPSYVKLERLYPDRVEYLLIKE
jgi:hypothetical protein